MLRACLVIFGAALLVIFDVPALLAQAPVPAPAPAPDGWPPLDATFARGSGFYLSVWKLGFCWALFALWVSTTDWLSRDCVKMDLKYMLWNSVAVGSFATFFILLWLIPWFWLGYLLLLTSYIAPLATYIVLRNKAVQEYQKVLTKAHLRSWFSEKIGKLGIKVSAEKPDPHSLGPDIKLTPRGGATDRDNNANLLKARQMAEAFLTAREWIHEALQRRADGILLDFGREAVAVRHQVDGVWLEAPSRERAVADPALEVLKTLTALNPADRRGKQAGQLGVEAAGKKYDCRLTSQGTETGERAIMLFGMKKLAYNSLEELGMRAKTIEQLQELVKRKQGLLLICSTPANGLTTLFDLTLLATDRYIRNFVAVEDVAKPERDIENIGVTTFNAAAGETPATVLPKLIRTYPDAFVVRDLVNGETVALLCDQVADEKRFVFASVRAKEAVEALLRVLLLQAPAAEFAGAITAVLNVRLVRKLCEKCKEAYAPPPEVLQQLGLPQGKIAAFYRPPTVPIDPKHPEKKCEVCGGIGYVGRTGIFELLMVDDSLRQVLVSSPKLEMLRDTARRARHRSLQEEGILLVARGVTSLPEVLRVLKA